MWKGTTTSIIVQESLFNNFQDRQTDPFKRILAIGAVKLDRLKVRIKICFGALSRNFRAFATSWFYFFTVVPPLINQQKKSCNVWESRPLEHESTLHGEAWRINFFLVLYFDLIKYPKSGLCPCVMFFSEGSFEFQRRICPVLGVVPLVTLLPWVTGGT